MSEKIKTPFGEIPFEVADLPNEAVFGLGKNQEVIKASDWIKKLQSQLTTERAKSSSLQKIIDEVDDTYCFTNYCTGLRAEHERQLKAEQEKVKKLVKRLVEIESYIDDRYVKDRINKTLEEVEGV